MFEPGQVVGQYRLDRTVHRGRSTVVFAATDLSSGQTVAVKMLADEYATDPAMRARFVEEAQYASQLDAHPSIATVYRWGQAGDSMYLVTEYIDGVSLAELLRRGAARGPMPAPEALAIADRIAEAVDFANKRGVLHRNLKPDNVMVRLDGSERAVYVVDFGIGKSADGRRGETGVFVGTADYASPEQIAGMPPLDRRADVYSFACVVFELLTGRPPYGGAPNDAARIASHLQAPIPSARARRPELPEAVDTVFAKALAKQRDARYGRCADVVKDLRAALASRPATAVAPNGSFAPPSGPAAPAPRARRRWPLLVAAAVIVAAAAAGWLALGPGRHGVSGDVSRRLAPPTTTTTTTTTEPPTTTTSTSTTTTTTSTTTTTTTSTTTTTIPLGAFGLPVGAAVTAATGPESAYALAVQHRGSAVGVAAPGSPAMYYADWLRLAVAGGSGDVTATAAGFAIDADRPVELRDFVVADGLVSDFTECVGETCTPLSSQMSPAPDCAPAPGCPNVVSRSGRVTAVQRATLLARWPMQVVFIELVPREGVTAAIVGAAEPSGAMHFDPATRAIVAVFPDRPVPGTELRMAVQFDDGSTDVIEFHYGE